MRCDFIYCMVYIYISTKLIFTKEYRKHVRKYCHKCWCSKKPEECVKRHFIQIHVKHMLKHDAIVKKEKPTS